MTIDLFADDQSVSLDPEANYYEELVGEGKKYKDEKALAYSRLVADEHIKKLESEQAALRQELETRMNMEKFLDKLNSAPLTPAPTNLPPQVEGEQPQVTSALKPEDVARLVAQHVSQMEQQRTASQNTEVAMKKLAEVYGPNYAQKLKQEITNLGVTEDEARALAGRSPAALYRLLGIDAQKPTEGFQAAPRSQATSFPTGKKIGYSHFEELRKKDLREYFSPKVQNEMHRLAHEMGDDFYKY
jgi:hypothetical protein